MLEITPVASTDRSKGMAHATFHRRIIERTLGASILRSLRGVEVSPESLELLSEPDSVKALTVLRKDIP